MLSDTNGIMNLNRLNGLPCAGGFGGGWSHTQPFFGRAFGAWRNTASPFGTAVNIPPMTMPIGSLGQIPTGSPYGVYGGVGQISSHSAPFGFAPQGFVPNWLSMTACAPGAATPFGVPFQSYLNRSLGDGLSPWAYGLPGLTNEPQAFSPFMTNPFVSHAPAGQLNQSSAHPLPGYAPTEQFGAGRWPLINIWEENDRIRIEAEVPGVSLDDIELQVLGRTLFIKTGRVINRAAEKGRLLYSERPLTSYTRSVQLPGEIDLDSVDAKLVNGVLELTLTRVGAGQRRTIRVSPTAVA